MFTDVVPAIDAAVPRPELRRRVLLCHHPMFADPFRALDHISAPRPFAYIWADHTGAGCGARRRAVTLRTRSESRGWGGLAACTMSFAAVSRGSERGGGRETGRERVGSLVVIRRDRRKSGLSWVVTRHSVWGCCGADFHLLTQVGLTHLCNVVPGGGRSGSRGRLRQRGGGRHASGGRFFHDSWRASFDCLGGGKARQKARHEA